MLACNPCCPSRQDYGVGAMQHKSMAEHRREGAAPCNSYAGYDKQRTPHEDRSYSYRQRHVHAPHQGHSTPTERKTRGGVSKRCVNSRTETTYIEPPTRAVEHIIDLAERLPHDRYNIFKIIRELAATSEDNLRHVAIRFDRLPSDRKNKVKEALVRAYHLHNDYNGSAQTAADELVARLFYEYLIFKVSMKDLLDGTWLYPCKRDWGHFKRIEWLLGRIKGSRDACKYLNTFSWIRSNFNSLDIYYRV